MCLGSLYLDGYERGIQQERSLEMRILIVDDHPLFIDGIRHIIQTLDDNVDLIEANSAKEALLLLEKSSNLDLILLDLHMPGLDGLSIINHRRIQGACVPLVVISGDDDPKTINSVINSGVMGFIPKSYSGKKLLKALRTIISGEIYIPESTIDHSYNSHSKLSPSTMEITKRQLQVLGLLASGYSNKQISSTLFLTENTVKSHVSALLSALNASNRTECVIIARSKGLIH